MAEKRTPPDPTGAGRRRKRAAPTIDLTATEIPAPAEAAPEPTPITETEMPSPEMPETAAAAEPPPFPPEEERIEAVPPPPPPPPEEERIEMAAAPPPPLPPAPERRLGLALAAGVAGAAIMAVLMGALAYAGLPPFAARDAGGAQVAALEKQMQDLRQNLQEVRERPAPAPAVDPKAVEALTQRVARLQNDIAVLPPGDKTLAERVGAAENAMRSLGVALTALNRREDDIAAGLKQAQESGEAAQKAVSNLRAGMLDVAKDASSAVAPAALDAVQQRVAALEQALKSAQSEIAKTAAGAQAARLALAAAALRDAVESGAPYAPALARVKSLGGEADPLAPLERFAQSGVPAAAALAQELNELMPAVVKASGLEQAPSGGFFERLQANAGKLVRIRPVDAPSGDAIADVLARAEVAAAKHDIDGALAALTKLPEAARKPADAWIAKAEARRAARDAARRFATARAAALGSQ
jgi:hypothetical protein